MGFVKNIKLPPTHYNFDLWVSGKDRESFVRDFSKYYAVGYESMDEVITSPNMALIMDNGDGNKAKQHTSIVMILDDKAAQSIVVHESYHVLCNLCRIIGTKLDGKGEEWSAYMVEYIYSNAAAAITEYKRKKKGRKK
jgi:hypothetical protein